MSVAPPEVTPSPVAERPPPTLEQALCDERTDCKLHGSIGGIAKKDGRRHDVMRVTFPEPVAKDPSDPPCTVDEFWLVARDKDDRLLQHFVIAAGCSPTSPANSWCGLPPRAKVRVRGSVVTVDWDSPALRCMSVYHHDGTQEWSLDTLAPLRSSSRFFRMVPPNERETTTWDFRTLRGTRTFVANDQGCPTLFRGPTPRIPSIAVDDAFSQGGWRTAGIEQCSTKIDRSHGVSLGGAKSKTALRVLFTPGSSLFVDVVPEGRKELPKSAFLRVCFADYIVGPMLYCSPPSEPACTEFELDGKIRSGDLPVERSPDRLRFKIEIPTGSRGITVAYIDPATGQTISSSPLKPFDTSVLSDVFESDGSCQLEDGALEFRF